VLHLNPNLKLRLHNSRAEFRQPWEVERRPLDLSLAISWERERKHPGSVYGLHTYTRIWLQAWRIRKPSGLDILDAHETSRNVFLPIGLAYRRNLVHARAGGSRSQGRTVVHHCGRTGLGISARL